MYSKVALVVLDNTKHIVKVINKFTRQVIATYNLKSELVRLKAEPEDLEYYSQLRFKDLQSMWLVNGMDYNYIQAPAV